MISIAPLLLFLVPVVQVPQPKPEAMRPEVHANGNPRNEVTLLDQVMVIVNADIITQGELLRAYRRVRREQPVRSELEAQRLQSQILYEFVRLKLAAQAGQDLGASEQLVDQMVKQRFDRWIQAQGGVVEATKILQAREMTTQEYKKVMRDELYSMTWREMITGEGPGVATRPQHDRYVRPGLLKFRFNNEVKDPGKYGELGGVPASFSMQSILLDPNEYGGVEKTKELANDLRQRIQGGEDMTELVQKYSAIKDKDGILRKLSMASMKRIAPEVAAWAETAEVESVSEPLPYEASEKRTLWQVCRLIEREAAVRPELESAEVQKAITRAQQAEWDMHRLAIGYQGLFRAAYVWPEELRESTQR